MVMGRWGVSRFLTDAELGFDARHAVVEIDNFTDQRVEFDVQRVEARLQTIESCIHACFQVIESSIYTNETRIYGIVLNRVHQDPNQYGEGRDTDCQI